MIFEREDRHGIAFLRLQRADRADDAADVHVLEHETAWRALFARARTHIDEHEIADCSRAERAEVARVAIERVAAQIQTERLLLEGQQFHLGPGRPSGSTSSVRRRRRREPPAEQIRLALLAIALHARAVFERGIDRPGQSRAEDRRRLRSAGGGLGEAVARAAFDERFEHALVDHPQVQILRTAGAAR